MGNTVCGTIILADCPNNCFTWKIPNCSKLVQDGSGWRSSPTFHYNGGEWCLQIDPFYGDGKFVAFGLQHEKKLCSSLEVVYRIFIPNSQKIIWESHRKVSCFTQKNRKGMFYLEKSAVKEMVDENSDCLRVCVQFDPPEQRSSGEKPQEIDASSCFNEEWVEYEAECEWASKNLSRKRLKEKMLNRLSEDFDDLSCSGDGGDVHIKAGDTVFLAHKIILSARSPVFKRMLQHDMVESIEGAIEIRDFDTETVKKLLKHLYTARLPEITDENVVALHRISDMYEVPLLVEACLEHMRMNVSEANFCDYFTVAANYGYGEMINSFKDFYAKNAKDIFKTEKFKTFAIENPEAAIVLISGMLEQVELTPKN